MKAKRIINREVNILTINDVYNLTPNWKQLGGFAEMKTLIDQCRIKDPNALFTINGDFLNASSMSQKYKGSHMIDVMNHMDLDYVVPGNHEMDMGIDVVAARMKESKFRWLCSNVVKADSEGQLYDGFTDYVIREINGLKVGIFGLISKEILEHENTGSGVEIVNQIVAARRVLQKFNQEGVDIIIALTHMNWEQDKELARRFPNINLILGGHNHNASSFVQGETLIVKTGSNAEYLGKVTLQVETSLIGENGSTVKSNKVYHKWKMIPNKGYEKNAAVAKVIEKYTEAIDENALKPLAVLKSSLDSRSTFVRSVETSMANLLADACVEYFGSDFSLLSAGSIRGDRYYNYGDELSAYDLQVEFPFANPIKMIELDGKSVKQAIEQGLGKAETVMGSFLVVSSGFKILFDYGRRPGARVVKCTFKGEEIQDEKIYKVTTTRYLANGGDDYLALRNHKDTEHPRNMSTMASVVEEYVRKHSENLKSVVEGRIEAI